MPQWSNAPPPSPAGYGLPIRRTPCGTPLCAVATSDNLLGCPTHFYGGRTVPCEGPGCEPCEHGVPWRWHAYLSALQTGKHEHFIFELTAQATDQFARYREKHGTLRGCFFEASRANRRPNGRVTIRCRPADLAVLDLPPAPNLKAALCKIWNIPYEDAHLEPATPDPTKKRAPYQRDTKPGPKPLLEQLAAPGNTPPR